MSVDWENIQYIFQIPIGWYQDISNKVEHAYGQNFITLREGYDGGLEIGVDEEMFSAYVQQYITGGTVNSVDGIPPDDNGDVILKAVRKINGDVPDDEGNIEFNAVMSVNDIPPDEDGNVDIDAVFTVNNLSPDANGNVNVGTVRSVNNTAPDANGNVSIKTGGGVESVDNIRPDANGNINLGALTTSKVMGPAQVVGIYGAYETYVCNTAHGHNHDSIVDWDTATQSFLNESDIGVYVAAEDHTHTKDDIEGLGSLPDFSKGMSGTINVVEKVQWNGTVLTYDYRTLTFTNGILTGAVAHTNTNIDTPTVVTWK